MQDLQTMSSLRRACAEIKPDMVLAYTVKPVIWGGIAAHGVDGLKFFAMIEGLGYSFQANSWKKKVLNRIVEFLYKISLSRAEKVIFLNRDNEKEFLNRNIIHYSKGVVIDGIGVNLEKFYPSRFFSYDPVFLSIGRLLGEKGFREFALAAKLVKQKYPQAKFQILGGEDPSSDSISIKEIKTWENQAWVEYLGETTDVRPFLEACSVYVLASYHEGMPRTVMEAMAMGRPVITTDAVGCRDTVQKGRNGFIVPVKDALSLAERMIWFIEHRNQVEKMGQESRRIAEERFDVRIINQQIMEIMGLESRALP